MKKYLTIGQAANKLGVSSETLRRWDNSGKFISLRHPMNNYRVYTTEQVNSLVKELQHNYSDQEQDFGNTYLPFLQTEYGQLYNMDAIEFMKNIESESVHLIFADPPYNIKKAEWDTFQSQKEYVNWSMKWINEAYRILHPTGSLYICGFSEILADIKWAASDVFKGCKWLVWYYRNKANLGTDWGRSHESLLHLRKSREYIFNIDEARIPYNAHTLKYPVRPQAESSQYANGKDYVWTPNPKGAKPKDVFEIPTISNSSWERCNHPTQKPIELVKKIILTSSNVDSIIVDPFGGSGTTYAISEALKRKWLGTEINIEYCSLIKARLLDKDSILRIASDKDEAEAKQRRNKLRG